jgi:AmmeMemoRadiSam system protein A
MSLNEPLPANERMPLNQTVGEFIPEHRQALLDVAAAAIDRGLSEGSALAVAVQDYPEILRQPRASFVTLRIGQRLRGCMGSLMATEPLVVNVARNAYTAAFRDPRFAPLARDEFPQLHIHLSLLGHPEPVAFESEAHLLSLIRPGIDGLTLIEGSRRATLLPAVWETLADPREFLAQLKRKAGLPIDYWSATLRVERYTAESVGHDG